MSDYLSNLVDRSLDRADVIQPRLPSLFEPDQGIGSPIAGLWQEAEPRTETIEQSVPEARNQRSVARQPSPIARIFDRVVNRRSAESDSNPQLPTLSTPTTTIEVSQPRFQPSSEVTQTGSVDRGELLPDPAAAIQPLSLQPQTSAQQIAADHISAEQPEIASPTTPDRERQLDLIINNPDRNSSLNPPPISVQNRIEIGGEPSLLPPDLTNSHNPQRGQIMESTAMEQLRSFVQAIKPEVVSSPVPPTPVIQVTIGRIEVRATTAPATPAATTTRSKSPVMGLDEYLDRRGGGR
jgi:hypothetical protein